MLGLVCSIQSTFHPAYFGLTLLGLVVACPEQRKRLVVVGAPLLLLLLLLCFKNAMLFNSSGTSSWLGMSLGRVVLVQLPERDRQALVDSGELSPLALIEPFSSLDKYPSAYKNVTGFEGVPALRQSRKSTGEENFNHLAYVGISQQYLKDCLRVIRRYPKAYIGGVARSAFIYTKSSSDYGWLVDNRQRIRVWDELYNRAFYGEVSLHAAVAHVRGDAGQAFHLYLSLALGLPALIAFGLVVVFSRKNTLHLSRAQKLSVLYLCFTIVFVAVVGVLLESGENNRFRFMTDPLSACLLALLLEWLARFRSPARMRERA